MKLARRLLINKLAGEPGFEPGLPGPEPGVLPLDYSPVVDNTIVHPVLRHWLRIAVWCSTSTTTWGCFWHKQKPLPPTESKSSPPPGLLSGIIPLNLPQKRAGIVQLLQSQLYNPCLAQYHSLPQLALKYQPLKLISSPRQSFYILPTTPERPLQAVPAVLSRYAFHDAPERASIEVALTLPESATKVALC